MTNEEWYYHDKKKNRLFLTDKAPKKAQESYRKFYAENDIDLVFYDQAMKDAEEYLRNKLKLEGKADIEIEEIVNDWKNG